MAAAAKLNSIVHDGLRRWLTDHRWWPSGKVTFDCRLSADGWPKVSPQQSFGFIIPCMHHIHLIAFSRYM
jgi:hypothetical protein